MTEDKKRIWAQGQLRERHLAHLHRKERARAVKQTRNTADQYLAGGRINRNALERGDEDDSPDIDVVR